MGAATAISPIPFDFYIFSVVAIPLAIWKFSKEEKSLSIEQAISIAVIIFIIYFIVAILIKGILTLLSVGFLAGGVINTLTNAVPGVIFAVLVGLVSGAIFKE